MKFSKYGLIALIIAGLVIASVVVIAQVSLSNSYEVPQKGVIPTPAPTASASPIPTYTVTVTQTANGLIAPGTGSVNAGSTPSYTITPNTNYQIASITANGASVTVATPSGQTYQFAAVSGPATLTATFTQITYLVIFATSGGGSGSTTSPTGTQSYTVGQAVPLTATPASGYMFSAWSTTGSAIGFDNSSLASTTAYIGSAGTITAVFKQVSVAITINGNPWTNGTPIDWGTNLQPGQITSMPISIENNGAVAIASITIQPDPLNPLPSGWTETTSTLTTALSPGLTANGYIYLTPSSTAVPGTYNWDSYIITAT